MRVPAALCALAPALLGGCPDRTIASVTPVQTGAITKDIPVEADIDILFVIDDSASTTDKQALFAQNFSHFVDQLDQFPGGRPNLHIGVVSTSVNLGTSEFTGPCGSAAGDGALQDGHGACGITGHFLSDIATSPATRSTNYSGQLKDALSCIAQLGDTGCGFEAPLEAMKRALVGPRADPDFLRQGAYLAVIFLTDEDDCSLAQARPGDPTIFSSAVEARFGGDAALIDSDYRCQPLYAYTCDEEISPTKPGTYHDCHTRTGSFLADPASYYDVLASLKDPSQLVVAVVAGDPATTISTGPLTFETPTGTSTQELALQPSCQTTINGKAALGRPAIRLGDFLGLFGSRGQFSTVCQSDYSGVLTNIGHELFDAISPCLEGPIDTTDVDPANPGVQPQCAVSDVQVAAGTEAQIPACTMSAPEVPAPGGPRPCWWVKANPAACTTATGLELHVERASAPAAGTSVRVSCAVGPS